MAVMGYCKTDDALNALASMCRCLAAAVAAALLEQALVLARLANALLSSWACTPVGTVTSGRTSVTFRLFQTSASL